MNKYVKKVCVDRVNEMVFLGKKKGGDIQKEEKKERRFRSRN